MKKPAWQRRRIATCLIALMLSFTSCRTIGNSVKLPEFQHPPWPTPPTEQQVAFSEVSEGLLLTPDEYRKLEENIIELRRYIAELEAQLIFYQSDLGDQSGSK